MKIRKEKTQDQDEVKKAIDLILELIILNNSIESTIWFSAMISILCQSLHRTGFTKKEFINEMKRITKHYEGLFE